MGTDDRLRASDKDRDQVADILREQYAQGRLTIEEFEERSAAALAARTMGDLAPLTRDLPVAPAPAPASSVRTPVWMFVVAGLAILFAVALLLGIAELAGPAAIVIFIVIARGRGRRYGRGFEGRSSGRKLPFDGKDHYEGRRIPFEGPGIRQYESGAPNTFLDGVGRRKNRGFGGRDRRR
jgi:Domain of unknown function (DUF1707)